MSDEPLTAADPIRVGTHSGSFHADEVFALATLRLAHGAIGIIRTRDPEALALCDLRVDVGRKYDPSTGDFDHHQGDAGERANGIRYASFGLVWRELGPQVCGSEAIAEELDNALVSPIDAGDNGQELIEPTFEGVSPYHLGRLVASYGPSWDDPDRDAAEQAGFGEALKLADGILQREIAAAQARARATGLVREAIIAAQDARIIEFDRGLPWKSVVMKEAPDALVVIYPRTNDWGVQAVPADTGSFDNRKDLPEAWAGLEGEELQAATGVDDAVFCHVGRFMAVAGSREGALRLAKLAVEG
ncbi:MAG: MYG1 family protein [Solirubrobacteraceae bacterium]|nr:MYG1 family protein [Patulibacter sp.]